MWLHGLIVPSDYRETPMPFYKILPASNLGINIPPYFSNPFFFEIHQWNSFPFQGFQIHFQNLILECSQPRVFAPLQGLPKVMMLTIIPLTQGISRC
jgi:hypothetical protein